MGHPAELAFIGKHQKQGHILRALSANILRSLGRIGLLTWLAGYRYIMPPTMILMIGTKKA